MIKPLSLEDKNDIFSLGIKKVSDLSYFKIITEAIPHRVTIIDAETYRIQYSNKYPKDIPEEKIIGTNLFDFLQPEYKDNFRSKLLSVKQNLQPDTIEQEAISLTNNRGRTWYRTHVTPLLNEDHILYSFLLISEDITEMKEKELEVIDKNEKIYAILNNTKDLILSIDLNYNLTEFNSVFMNMVKLGYNIDLKVGMSVFDFVDPSKYSKLKDIYQRVALGEVLTDIESFNSTKGVVHFETSYHPIYNFNKEIIGISVFSKDITTRIKNEEKIRVSLKEKEILLAEIHHRIKNNLAIVSSMLQLQELNITNSEAKEALKLSRNRIKSTALVHELLYKNDSFQHINLHEYLTQLFNNLRPDENKHLDLSGNQVSINLNTAMPFGLLLNELLINTFKHSYKADESGKIEISSYINNNHLTLEYCDCKGSFPEHIDFNNPKTTGLLLIHTFTQQLDGEIKLVERNPPKYIITVPINE